MGNTSSDRQEKEITEVYEMKARIGSGNFANVYRAKRRKDKKQFAIKVIKKYKLDPSDLASVNEEIEIMHKIENKHCVKLFEIYETSKKVYMVLELCTGGELFDRISAEKKFSEQRAAKVIQSVAEGLKYLHSIGVVHRDLKPENLIYASEARDSPIKITDFGLAKIKGASTIMDTACGTPGYVAPEVLRAMPYDKEVDLWSLGVILYILLCGFPPFYSENKSELLQLIVNAQYEFQSPFWDNISDSAKGLVAGLLQKNPRKRLTVDQVLAHPWIAGGAASATVFSDDHSQRIRLMLAKRKLRTVVKKVLAINRFARTVLSQHR